MVTFSKWNARNFLHMQEAFSDSKFNRDISNWGVQRVKTMYNMFASSDLDIDVSEWNLVNVHTNFGFKKYNRDIHMMYLKEHHPEYFLM